VADRLLTGLLSGRSDAGIDFDQLRSLNMNELRYRVVIGWSPADKAYVAMVPDLPGCMAHGSTYEIALANVKDAAELWLDTAREDGASIPEPSDQQLASA